MDRFKRFRQHLAVSTSIAIFLPGILGMGLYIWLREGLTLEILTAAAISAAAFVVAASINQMWATSVALIPLKMTWQAVWHVSPHKSDTPPPKPDTIKARAARELVASMVTQIYNLASNHPLPQPAATPVPAHNFLESIPLAILILDKNWVIKIANQTAITYLGAGAERVVGAHINDALHMSFKSDDTLDSWLKATDSKATDSKSWEHVRVSLEDGAVKQFDLSASYNRDNPDGNEVVLAIFDRTETYKREETSTSYVALAVHELRTPLTLLRGYIEVFEDELGENLSPEHQEFMRKMSASAQNLTSFVNNILNAARVDENQFIVSLHEADWKQTLSDIVKDFELRAQVRGKKLNLHIEDNLPTVALDRIAIYEVVGNLIENAIKYSGQSTDITIHAEMGPDNMVHTTVEDQGDGIPENVIGELFTKFYRSHRSKKTVSGNGLGLYLVKSFISAHGGSVWVNSKEGEGSRFTFSLQPFANIKDQASAGEIEHQAGGWIKNHSLYRR